MELVENWMTWNVTIKFDLLICLAGEPDYAILLERCH